MPTFNPYQARQAELAALASEVQAYRNRAAVPAEAVTIGGMSAAPSYASVIASLLNSHTADRKQREYQAGMAQLEHQQTEALSNGVKTFMERMQGGAVPSSALQPNVDGTPQMMQKAPDVRGALVGALQSGHPVLQDLAMKALPKMLETPKGMEAKDLAQYAIPADVLMYPTDASKWRAKPHVQGFEPGQIYSVDGQLVPPGSGVATQLVRTPEGVVRSGSFGTTAPAKAPVTNMTVNLPDKTLAPKSMEIALDRAKTIESIDSSNRQLDTIVRAVQSGAYTNKTSSFATAIADLSDAVGLKVDRKKLANTASARKAAAELKISLQERAGSAKYLTAQEMEQLSAAIPQVDTSPAAIYAVASLLYKDNIYQKRVAEEGLNGALDAAGAKSSTEMRKHLRRAVAPTTTLPQQEPQQFPGMQPLPEGARVPFQLPPGFKAVGVLPKG